MKGDKRSNHESQNTDAQGMRDQQPLYTCFVDFTKAFDSISHDKLWVTMMDIKYPLVVSVLACGPTDRSYVRRL